MGNSVRRSLRAVERAERDRKICDLRLEGKSFRAIAASLSITVSMAYAGFSRAVANIPKESADEIRLRLLAQLDEITAANIDGVRRGNEGSARSLLGAIDRVAKLTGLYLMRPETANDGKAMADIDWDSLTNQELQAIIDSK